MQRVTHYSETRLPWQAPHGQGRAKTCSATHLESAHRRSGSFWSPGTRPGCNCPCRCGLVASTHTRAHDARAACARTHTHVHTYTHTHAHAHTHTRTRTHTHTHTHTHVRARCANGCAHVHTCRTRGRGGGVGAWGVAGGGPAPFSVCQVVAMTQCPLASMMSISRHPGVPWISQYLANDCAHVPRVVRWSGGSWPPVAAACSTSP